MMPEVPRHLKITIGILLAAVIAGAVYFRFLAKRILAPAVTEQKSAQHLAQQSLTSPADVPTQVTLYLPEMEPAARREPAEAGSAQPETAAPTASQLVPRQIMMPLASEPPLRAKQLLQAWLVANQESQQSLVPQDARLREVFLTADGSALVDFSTEFSTHAMSGIASETLVVSAVVDTLIGNLTGIQKVKILINGEEAETLAGHVDLDRFYAVDKELAPVKPAAAPVSAPAPAQGATPTAR